MRRTLFTLMVGAVLLALVPATALARHHNRGQRAQARARHHARVRVKRFGTNMPSQSGSSGGGTQTGQENDQNAGTVASFTNGTLTIALNNGSTVSGKVTPSTELECDAARSSSMQRDDRRGGDSSEGGDRQSEDNEDEGAEQHPSCSTADLQPGTVVREAELRLSGSGANWQKVELVTSSTSSSEPEENEAEGNDS